ncbi:MAG: hypothetical protein HC820_09890, partial [Hydrococcus sp. RM1_1_31]|nr:hypothetical protein [Hydrococcus sp. RM1_1_31]
MTGTDLSVADTMGANLKRHQLSRSR